MAMKLRQLHHEVDVIFYNENSENISQKSLPKHQTEQPLKYNPLFYPV